ncbi:von Willebrand factor A domain-containing protein 5A, partial [Madurella mycetomatis]
MTRYTHICGFYYVVPSNRLEPQREYLPRLSLSAHAKIISSTSRTTLTQTFANPKSEAIPELRYAFPLYDGVSVVGFTCTINDDRVIRGVVKERAEARKTYKEAVHRGETAGLLEQLPQASDVFTTTVGNVPAGATLKVDVTYLGELKHDAEVDGVRYTIPTHIAPRYGQYPGQLLSSATASKNDGISIIVDVELPNGSNIKNVQSPSHPISVTIGNTSAGAAQGQEMSLQKASATLALATAELGNDFVLQVVATNMGNPIAVLETHPTIPNHRALMATLVPRFNLPSSRPEIVFLCDRSGSMQNKKIANLKTALHIFLKSLPVGVKFNICSFGSRHAFLFPEGSKTYDATTLEQATNHVNTFTANFGGTDIYNPMEQIFKQRYTDMDLEVFLMTDGEIWDQERLFDILNTKVAESNGAIRVFSLGIGRDVSHSLIEGVARAGNGFSQTVGEDENMNSKAVRMLKAALTPHTWDYTLEIKYEKDVSGPTDDDFEMVEVEKVMDALNIVVGEPNQQKEESTKKPISLFDESANPDVEVTDASLDNSAGGKYSRVPPVSEPKLLQAPFIIPALYPFSRTSVYLLLSPETVQKQPKSVILRGKSAHGPLELEVPVTVVSEKGETIHQLAARKAVQELEEGRGWIQHAKDGRTLLKKKYVGRFSDMVEREAVRLGVKYQVGGKWCSFVAVEANGDVSAEETLARIEVGEEMERATVFSSSNMARRTRAVPMSLGVVKKARGRGVRTMNAMTSPPQDFFYGRQSGPSVAMGLASYAPAMGESSAAPGASPNSTAKNQGKLATSPPQKRGDLP